jgi:choline transport protein
MVTACIVLLYVSYAIPVVCLLKRGRNNIPHGPFWLGPIGLVANIVLLVWTCFTLVMYSFPFTQPVNAGSQSSPPFPLSFSTRSTFQHIQIYSHHNEMANLNPCGSMTDMNYVSAVYGVAVLVIYVDWLVRGRWLYRGQAARHEERVALTDKFARGGSIMRQS